MGKVVCGCRASIPRLAAEPDEDGWSLVTTELLPWRPLAANQRQTTGGRRLFFFFLSIFRQPPLAGRTEEAAAAAASWEVTFGHLSLP